MQDERLARAIGFVQAGKIKDARELLENIIKEDRSNIPAWRWYAQTWQNDGDKTRIWEACLRFNPSNSHAQQALSALTHGQVPEQTRKEQAQPAEQTNLPPIRNSAPRQARRSQWLLWVSIVLFVIVAVVAGFVIVNSAPANPADHRYTQPVEYYLYVPKTYSADHELPLFIGIHGFGGSGLDCWNLWQSYAEREGFILLCPTISDAGGGWYQDTGETLVWSVVGQVKKEYRVKQGMFIVGFSAGAQFVQGFAFNYPQYVSGVSVLSAGNYYRANLGARNIPFLVVIGGQDDPISVEQSALFSQYLTQNGFDVQYEVLPGVGHTVTSKGVRLTVDLFKKTAGK